MITMFRFIRLEPCGVPEAVIQDDPTRSLQAKRHGTGLGANLCYEPRLRVSLITFSRARLRDCCRPRARVSFSGVGLGPSYYPASLLWSPGPRPSPVFRSAICDCLSLNVSISLAGSRCGKFFLRDA